MKGKTIIVTGASSGFGRETALALAGKGANLVLAARRKDKLLEVKKEAEKLGGKAIVCVTDVSNSSQVQAMVEKTLKEFGRIDVLINNAGIASYGFVEDFPEEEWRKLIDINLTGVFLCSKAVLPAMLRQGEGRIIQISSIAGTKGSPRRAAYCASKWGVIGFSKALTLELLHKGISVNVVCPGVADTNLVKNARHDSDDVLFEIFADKKERAQMLKAKDIADCILYLCSLPSHVHVGELVILPKRFMEPIR